MVLYRAEKLCSSPIFGAQGAQAARPVARPLLLSRRLLLSRHLSHAKSGLEQNRPRRGRLGRAVRLVRGRLVRAGAWSARGRPRAPRASAAAEARTVYWDSARRVVWSAGGRALARADRRSGEPGARRLLGYFCEGLGGQHRAPSTLFASRDLSQAAWTSQSCIGAPPEAPQWAPSSSLSRPPCSRRRQTSGPWAVAARSRPTTLLIIRKSRRSERRRSRAAPAPVDAPAPVEPPSEAGRDAVGLTRGRVATPPRPLHGSSVDGSRDRPSTGRAWIGLALGTRVP